MCRGLNFGGSCRDRRGLFCCGRSWLVAIGQSSSMPTLENRGIWFFSIQTFPQFSFFGIFFFRVLRSIQKIQSFHHHHITVLPPPAMILYGALALTWRSWLQLQPQIAKNKIKIAPCRLLFLQFPASGGISEIKSDIQMQHLSC